MDVISPSPNSLLIDLDFLAAHASQQQQLGPRAA
jgi:hypothetical protein